MNPTNRGLRAAPGRARDSRKSTRSRSLFGRNDGHRIDCLVGTSIRLMLNRRRILKFSRSGTRWRRGCHGINGCALFCAHPQSETITNGSNVARARITRTGAENLRYSNR
jgi:hypothetical protein